jgi:hypothetical protein
MGYREARELARIRHELRERLMSRRADGAGELLERLRAACENDELASAELRGEYERWRLRFQLMLAC